MKKAESMPAGRELDALVSERAMGIPVVCYDWPCGREPECGRYEAAMFVSEKDGRYNSNCSWHDERGPVVVAYPDLDHRWPPYEDAKVCREFIAHVKPVPRYSADIAAAWEMMEKLIATGATPQIYFSSGCWWVRLGGLEAATSGETLPLAVCRAALKAVGASNDNPA